MCLRWYQHFEHRWAKGHGLGSPWTLAVLPRSNHNPCDGDPCPSWHIILRSRSTDGFLFCYFIDHPAAMPSTDFFYHQLARKFIPDQMILEVLSSLVFYDSMIPSGTWLILSASFPVPFSGTQLTSIGCRMWQCTQAVPHQQLLAPYHNLFKLLHIS